MPRSKISCPRCGYVTNHLKNYRKHLDIKTMCMPLKADVVPTMENAIRQRVPAATTTVDIAINGNHNQQTNNIDNSTTTNNNFNVSAAPVRPANIGHEDMSHVPTEMWLALIKMALEQDCHAAAMTAVQLINFNPARPSNMNVLCPHDGEQAACYDGRWSWMHKEDAALKLIEKRMDDLREMAYDNVGDFGQARYDELSDKVEDELNEGSNQQQLNEMVSLLTQASRIVRLFQPALFERVLRTRPSKPATTSTPSPSPGASSVAGVARM